MTSPPPKPRYDPVDTTFDPREHSQRDDVESPSLTNGNALARFEFEPGRSKDGTKVLMVEWEEDESTKGVTGNWEISWKGKKTFLPARDRDDHPTEDLPPLNRLYFLLGPGVAIPTQVKLQKGHIAWRTAPLPAIFSPELGATAREAGKKGVLHTIWAKKRLQVLQEEIEAESKENVEGIGYQMAAAEKDWIEQNFGVLTKPPSKSFPQQQSAMSSVMGMGNAGLNSPASPRSPGGGRLMDKLKGLKLGTSAQDLSSSRKTEGSAAPESYHPLSPEGTDVAVGSFGSFAALKGAAPTSTLAAKPPQPPAEQQRKVVAQRPPPPPESFISQQRPQGGMGMASLNAFASGDISDTGFSQASIDDDKADDLFALPMSPRSPEMGTKSPFSFTAQDTMRYLKEEKASS
ncbi:uncharacterized protein MYCFIDRAFT_211894 [Pseudocercospora fijiensis CIRAD86]|uniref:Uncharacterized protein n=1 Tax=Pseudocercospora fijiensis (strain CIRAD86) TaxID=383855 RepID=M2YQ85_PSEFD|nr:uncharacterized protein MYCFIDRAFT_211894 [Pseudocercospora fijiensis CIRAD86]EME79880.1 hypothetical protein MYCFIDRAFT_211894 [Pseudocercospora fijiensis CIRAD86]